jgi:NADH:ubiquinone oxidoreductase subunit C
MPLRDDPALHFDMLLDVCGVDYLERTPRFKVVYHLRSLETARRLRLKVPVAEEQTEVESVTSVWKGANWFEREAYDLYGIRFRHHPDLRRILTHAGFGNEHLCARTTRQVCDSHSPARSRCRSRSARQPESKLRPRSTSSR